MTEGIRLCYHILRPSPTT